MCASPIYITNIVMGLVNMCFCPYHWPYCYTNTNCVSVPRAATSSSPPPCRSSFLDRNPVSCCIIILTASVDFMKIYSRIVLPRKASFTESPVNGVDTLNDNKLRALILLIAPQCTCTTQAVCAPRSRRQYLNLLLGQTETFG